MKFVTEVVQDKQKALIISKEKFDFIDVLKKRLKENSVEPFFSSVAPKRIKDFDYCFFIFHKNKKLQIQIHHHHSIKTVDIAGNTLTELDLDKILWFAFSKTKENNLKIRSSIFVIPSEQIKTRNTFLKYLTRKNFFYILLFLLITLHLIFIPFVLISSLFAYKGYVNLRKNNFSKAESNASIGESYNNLGESFYSIVRPSYLLFGLAILPDNIIEINKNSFQILAKTQKALDDAKEVQRLIFTKNKTANEKESLVLRFKNLNQSLESINDNLANINQKLDLPFSSIKKIKSNLIETSDLIDKTQKLLSYAESVLTKDEPKKYLVFFANNMELRPGGGFIGSFAIISIKNYEIEEIKVNDVYDADGQLTAHIDPPKPIEQYLKIPHWFLRDSNFSPDFVENYQKALFFLEKEIGETNFSGGIVLTTTAVENILTAFDNLYLPDYKENINSKNFYLKTQFYVENNFFPGSIQKRVFLSAIIQQIILKLNSISSEKLLIALKKSLDEKQMAVYIDDPLTQTLFDTSFWSGRVIEPKCLSGSDCISDYLFPYDANVGANKANFFINRFFQLKTFINSEGKINHVFSIQYKNDSPAEIFPTGTYRNYLQILLPANSNIRKVTKDGVLIENVDQKDDKLKLIGFYVEVPPKKTVEVKIDYQLGDRIDSAHKVYQLIFQKQLGANNSDLILDFDMDKKISLLNQNFSPLVKENQILYNTSLSTDKIFFIELKKEL